jgi:hypothetical protein
MIESNVDLVDAIEFLRGLLKRIAKFDDVDPSVYAAVRAELLADPEVARRLPRVVRDSPTPRDVWGQVRDLPRGTGGGLRQGRIEWINERFDPLAAWARESKHSPGRGRTPPFAPSSPPAPTSATSFPGDPNVIVLGKDTGDHIALLHEIQSHLRAEGVNSRLIKELPDEARHTPEQKVRMWIGAAPFVVVEDTAAAGQIAEIEYAKQGGVICVVLRQEGKGSTWMFSDATTKDYPFVKSIEYPPGGLQRAVSAGVKWAKGLIAQREVDHRAIFPWLQKS